MNDVLDRQLLLHDAAALIGVALIRPATLEGMDPLPIIGGELDRGGLLAELRSALDAAWPDRPEEIDDLEAFLGEAYSKVVATLNAQSGEGGFVPAANWTDTGRELLLEHLRADVDALIGGVRSEGLWMAFGETGDTAPLADLVAAGMLIKLRLVGAFLVLGPSRYADELTAADFFQAGEWEKARDQELAANVLHNQRFTHKQIAHLTVSRPLPEEVQIYRPTAYGAPVAELLTLLEQFTAAVDPRLVPEFWAPWVASRRPRLTLDLE